MAAIFCKRPWLLHQSIVLLCENARHYTPNLTAVYGCTSDRLRISPQSCTQCFISHWILEKHLLASDCSGYWCEASYHLLATDTQQQCLTLEYKPWYHYGVYAMMSVVTTVMSDVCAMYWSNTGCCEWWGFCVTCWSFLQWIICSSSDFHPAMPTQFCNFPYISIIY